ncbi:MAG: hypothetical protein WC321_02415 [Candidatus Omnitrophota bacterium]|jgi:hypothetical protein
MLKHFHYSNVTFKKQANGDRLVINGEITNASLQNYQAVLFRIFLYLKKRPLYIASITINGFNGGQTRGFEQLIEDLEYSKVIGSIVGCEIVAETAY